MAINIKELFSGDSDNIRLDKINYNFDQIVANGGGPIGLTGSKGDVGPQGLQGAKGDKGDQGIKGEPGIATDYFVRTENAGLSHYVLSPVSDLSNHDAPATVLFGEFVDGSSTLTDINDAPVVIKMDQTHFGSALRFTTDQAAEYIDIRISDDGSTRLFQFVPNAVGSSDSVYRFVGKTIKLYDAGDKIVLNSSSSSIDSALTISGSLKITSGTPGVNKYLKSDATGNTSWSALGTAVPVGTIVMVSKFVLDNNVDWAGDFAGESVVVDYKGRGTGTWDGWYYCWGKTWNTYETPDLRERYPMGFAGSSIAFTGGSTEALYAAYGEKEASNNTTLGYFGTNDVDNLQAKSTLNAHKHGITHTNYQVNVATSGTTVWVPGFGSQYAQMQTNDPTTTPTTDISPRSAVVGFMIYLGTSGLTYAVTS